jgi:hypothetical protein
MASRFRRWARAKAGAARGATPSKLGAIEPVTPYVCSWVGDSSEVVSMATLGMEHFRTCGMANGAVLGILPKTLPWLGGNTSGPHVNGVC